MVSETGIADRPDPFRTGNGIEASWTDCHSRACQTQPLPASNGQASKQEVTHTKKMILVSPALHTHLIKRLYRDDKS